MFDRIAVVKHLEEGKAVKNRLAGKNAKGVRVGKLKVGDGWEREGVKVGDAGQSDVGGKLDELLDGRRNERDVAFVCKDANGGRGVKLGEGWAQRGGPAFDDDIEPGNGRAGSDDSGDGGDGGGRPALEDNNKALKLANKRNKCVDRGDARGTAIVGVYVAQKNGAGFVGNGDGMGVNFALEVDSEVVHLKEGEK